MSKQAKKAEEGEEEGEGEQKSDDGFDEDRRAQVVFGSLTTVRDEEVVELKKPTTSSTTPSKHIMLKVGQSADQVKDSIASVCAIASDPFIKSFGDPDSFDIKLVSSSQVSTAKKGSTAPANMRNLVYPMPDAWTVSSPPPTSAIKAGDVTLCVTLRDKAKAMQGQGGKAPLAPSGRGGGSNAGESSVEAYKVQYITSCVIAWETGKGNMILLQLDFAGAKKVDTRKMMTSFLSDLLKPAVVALKVEAKTKAMSQPVMKAKFDAAIVAIDMDQLPEGVSKRQGGGKRKRGEDDDIDKENGPGPVAAAPVVDYAEQLKKLAVLHADGVLDDDEFKLAKKKCLDRL